MEKVIKISDVAIGILSVFSTGQAIYAATANAMDAVEVQGILTGEAKKRVVLTFMKDVVLELGENWDFYVTLISSFIDQIKTAFNAVKKLFI